MLSFSNPTIVHLCLALEFLCRVGLRSLVETLFVNTFGRLVCSVLCDIHLLLLSNLDPLDFRDRFDNRAVVEIS
jgi:hypothetical protein